MHQHVVILVHVSPFFGCRQGGIQQQKLNNDQ
jgi:hypothetical protein